MKGTKMYANNKALMKFNFFRKEKIFELEQIFNIIHTFIIVNIICID